MQHNTTTAQSAAPASPSLGPIIFRKGWRVYLRPISAEDIPAITVWINDWEIHQFLGVTTPSSLDTEE
jgi:RimJ/RimL family protein N-acetyltransferase